jgi:glycerol kinase
VQDNGGVYLVPAFTGLSAPYWDAEARAAIIGMSAHTSKAHVVRAALESIAYQIRDVLEMMRGDAGVELTQILADGGATRNSFLMQFIADVVRIKVHVSDVAESSPLGAAWVGAVGQGVFSSLAELAALPSDAATYEPRLDEITCESLCQGWRQAVNRVL